MTFAKKYSSLFSYVCVSPTCKKFLFLFFLVLILSGISFTVIAISLLEDLGTYAAAVNATNIQNNIEEFLINYIHEQTEKYNTIFQKLATTSSFLAMQTAAALDTPLGILPDNDADRVLVRNPVTNIFENSQQSEVQIQFWGEPIISPATQRDMHRLSLIDPLLKSINRHNPEIVCAYVITSSGIRYQYPRIHQSATILPSDGYDIRTSSFFTMLNPVFNPEHKTQWSYIYMDDSTGELKITASSPVYDSGGDFQGIAAVDINLETIISGILRPGRGEHKIDALKEAIPLVLDAHGIIIALDRTHYKLFGLSGNHTLADEHSVFYVKKLSDSSLPAVTTAGNLILNNRYVLTKLSLQNTRYFLVAHTMASTGWHLCLLLPETKLFSSIESTQKKLHNTIAILKRRFGLGAVALMLFSIGTAMFLARVFVGPLQKLVAATKSIAAGDFSVRVDGLGKSEFSKLGKTFNDMASALQQAEAREREYTEMLEQEVERQTHKLRAQAQQLEAANAQLLAANQELRHSRDTLQQSQKRLALHVRQTMVGVIEWDLDFKVSAWNPAAEKMFGYSRAEALSRHAFEIIVPPEEQPKVQSVWETVLRTKHEMISINKNITRCGDRILCEWHTTPLVDDNGDVIAVASLCRDITERARADEERARLSSVIEHTSSLIVIMDEQGKIEYINPAAEALTGYRLHEVRGVNPFTTSRGTHDHDFYQKIWAVISSGTVWAGTLNHVTKEGNQVEIETVISPIVNSHDEMLGYAATGRDISGEIELKKQLQHAQKLEAIGTLAGGIAHDFNNILTAIIGFTELSLMKIRGMPELENNLSNVLTASNRAKKLVEQILTFSRQKKVMSMRPVSLSTLIKETMQFLRASMPSTIELRQTLDAEHDIVLGDPTQLQQILINLCTNAKQALPNAKGSIAVSLVNKELSESERTALGDAHPGTYVVVSVHDTGHGIDPSIIDRIFEPFFTTKAPGEGTGLGLSVVHGIVKSCGGHIKVTSNPNQGTTFSVYFPAAAATDTFMSHHGAAEMIHTGTETILVVDDEQAIVVMLQDLLETIGYTVFARTSSVEALELFRSQPGRFDVLITDQTMPNMTGVELAKNILKIRSDMPVIICTGYSEIIDESTAAAIGISAFLTKPVLISALTRTIRSVLAKKHRMSA